MKVLVTGASGTIGRPLTLALAQAGYTVRAAMRDHSGQTFPAAVELARLPDLSGPVDWAPLLAGMDAVVHLAGIAHIGVGVSEAAYDRVNHRATADLASAAMVAGLRRLVLASSIRAQTAVTAAGPLSEADDPRPTEPYGRSKLAAEAAVRAAGVRHTILRPVLVYARGASGNLASLIRLAGLPLPLPFGLFTRPRSLLAVENLIAAIRFALEDARAENETFIVSDPSAVSVADIIAICRRAAGREPALLAVPPALFAMAFTAAGRRDTWDRLAGALLAPPARLLAAGWHPVTDTPAGLTVLVQAASPPKSGTAARSAP